MKHTPGPWNKTEDKLTQQYYIARPYRESVLHIANVTKEDVGYGISEEEYHANASLIAAAPELLEACKDLAHQLAIFNKKFLHKNDKYSALQTGVVQSYNKAIKAIAKAEGKRKN